MLARGPGRVTFNTSNAQMEYNVNSYRIRSFYGWHLGKDGEPALIIGYRAAVAFLRSLHGAGDGCARLVKWD